MTLLSYNSKYVVTSTTAVTTTSSSLQDDTQASQIFSLSASKTVLIIYQANSNDGQTMPGTGMECAISVDGVDKALCWDSPYDANYATRNCAFWIGTLASGSHTIKGRFASGTNGSTATINNRVLLIYILDGDEFQYVDNATLDTVASGTFKDDAYASVTFTPSGTCKLLALYNISNSGATEDAHGKKATISIGGADYGQAEKAPYGGGKADSVFTCHVLSRTAVSTTVKGRFAAQVGLTVSIHRRQLGVLLFADATLMDVITSTTQVSTTSDALVDDTQGLISRSTTSGELLVVAVGTKRYTTQSHAHGECYGIKVDANERTKSRGAPGNYLEGNSAATAWAETVSAAAHTVQGRFSNNTDAYSAKIDARQIVALWFVGVINVPTVTTQAATSIGLD